jgi:hypothetical protein
MRETLLAELLLQCPGFSTREYRTALNTKMTFELRRLARAARTAARVAAESGRLQHNLLDSEEEAIRG